MVKRTLLLGQFLLAGFLVKFLDADSDSGGSDSDSDSGGSDSGDSDSGSNKGSSELSSSSSETAEWSDSGDSNSDSNSSQRKKPLPNAQDLQNLSGQDLSQIPFRDE